MFNRNTYRSPAQRANKAMLNILARLGGCGFLIYYVIKILTIPEEARPNPTMTIIIGIAFILVAAFLVVITVMGRHKRHKDGPFQGVDL
jgi:hypothetical protein